MFSNYKSFKELKEEVSETYASIAQVLEKFGWDLFSADGQNKVEAYAILDDCFRISRSIESLIDNVADEICKLEKEMTPDDAADKKAVIRILANYIVDNVADELTDGRREFDYNHRKRGC